MKKQRKENKITRTNMKYNYNYKKRKITK